MTEVGASHPLVLGRPEASGVLFGHAEAEQTLLNSYRSGKIHHAWIIAGPPGIGKATLAFRFARFILVNPDPRAPQISESADLGTPLEAGAARLIAARAHPNLMVLERPRDEEGKATATVIPVDSVRMVGRFLGTTAADAGWRIIVVDAADDLNRASANALLKMLEEPPPRALFLVVSHLPGRLLPTIRSRCRILSLKPLPAPIITGVLEASGAGESEPDRQLAAQLAEGSLSRALDLAEGAGKDTARITLEILDGLPRVDAGRLQSLAQQLGSRGGEDGYRLATTLLLDWIAARARTQAQQGCAPAQLAPWSEVWEKVSRALAETETYNLDRTQTLLMALRSVSAAAVQDAAHA